MKKIITITPWFYPKYGGGETHHLKLANYLINNDYDFKNLSFNFKHPKIKLNFKVKRFDSSKTLKERKEAYNKIFNYLKKEDEIDIVYMYFLTSSDLPVFEQFKIINYLYIKKVPIVMRITSEGRLTAFLKKYP